MEVLQLRLLLVLALRLLAPELVRVWARGLEQVLVVVQQWALGCRLEPQQVEWRRWEELEPLWVLPWVQVPRWPPVLGLRRWGVVLLWVLVLALPVLALPVLVWVQSSVVLLAPLEPRPSGVNSSELAVAMIPKPNAPQCQCQILHLLRAWLPLSHRHRTL